MVLFPSFSPISFKTHKHNSIGGGNSIVLDIEGV